MLSRCIAHHLAIGIDRVFVSLNLDDPESACAAQAFEGTGRVRSARVETFAADPFHYFTSAIGVVAEWVSPEWILFVDSDDFWIPASGRIQNTAGLDDADLLDVPLFQMPPIRERDGSIRAVDVVDDGSLMVASPILMDAEYLTRHPDSAIIRAGGSKVLVRPEFVGEVGRGAHDIAARAAEPRRSTPDDLVIAHAPFTSMQRFRTKVERIRARLALYGDRFKPGQAWHWYRWIAIDDQDGLEAEFGRQVFDAADVAALLAQGVLTTPARVFAGRSPGVRARNASPAVTAAS
jgi:hypothetical protein